jgi:phosphoglycolate phosphatase-like HAD superfamily hydrolase/NAD-dependent SIR2 family protein deacetylase
MFNTIVLDFDGPIFPGRVIAEQALRETWEHFAYLSSAQCPSMIGTPLFDPARLIALFTVAMALTPNQVMDVQNYYVTRLVHYESLHKIDPDLNRSLRRAKEVGLKLAVLSKRTTASLDQLLVGLGIRSLFDFVAGADGTTKPKPSPEALKECASKLSVSLDDLVFIGDSDTDFECAHGAGVKYYQAGYSDEPSSMWRIHGTPQVKTVRELNSVVEPVRRQEKFSAPAIPAEIEQALERDRFVVLAGAGISIASGYGDWATEYEPALLGLGASTLARSRDMIDALQLVASEPTRSQRVLTTFQQMFARRSDRQPNSCHNALLRLSPARIWTTNYDVLFETAINAGALDTRTIHDDSELLQAVFDSNLLIKLNGDFEHVKLTRDVGSLEWNVVLTQEQFDLAEQTRREMWNLFERDFRENCILFVGTSHKDPVLRRVLSIARRRVNVTRFQHFTFAKRSVDPLAETEEALAAMSLARNNVQTIWINSHDQVTEFCARLAVRGQHPVVGFSGNLVGDDDSKKLPGATIAAKEIGQITRSLGHQLALRGFRVTSGCGPWVGREAVDAAFQAEPSRARYYLRKSGGTTYRTKASVVVSQGSSYEDMRAEFIPELTLLIAIGGEAHAADGASGTESEILAALKLGIPVILIPQGGGAVATFSASLPVRAASAYVDARLRTIVLEVNSKVQSQPSSNLLAYVSSDMCDDLDKVVVKAMMTTFASGERTKFMPSRGSW